MRSWNKKRCVSAFVWLGSICVASFGMAAIMLLLPEIPAPRLPTPFAPQVRWLPEDFWTGSAAGELLAVRSPALIALPNWVIRSGAERSRINWTGPALAADNAPALFLARSLERGRGLGSTAGPVQKQVEPTIPTLPRTGIEPAFRQMGTQPAAVRMTCHGDLKGVALEWRGDALGPWMAPGSFWHVVFNARFAADGRPVSVFIVSPAADNALNSQALRTLYHSRLKEPGKPREGLVSLWFDDARTARTVAEPLNGKGNNAGL